MLSKTLESPDTYLVQSFPGCIALRVTAGDVSIEYRIGTEKVGSEACGRQLATATMS